MNETEIGDYFNKLTFRNLYLNNFIDYEDIENPVKTFQQVGNQFQISPNTYLKVRFDHKKHTFKDNVSRLQLFGGETETNFLNIQDTIVIEKERKF